MNNSARTVVLPALAAAIMVAATACSAQSSAPAKQDAAAVADALVVTAAQSGDQQVAVGTPGPAGPTLSPTPQTLRLTSYDPAAGTAVLSAAGNAAGNAARNATATGSATGTAKPSGPAASPSARSSATAAAPTAAGTATASASATALSGSPGQVHPGQLIASPPTAAAPRGALLAVTAVHQDADGSVRASTRPATLAELLGGAEADGKVAVDPHAISVKPLVKDLKLSFGATNGGATADASGTLQLDANAPLPLPGGAHADASGSLQLHPAVHFAYHGAAQGSPRTASIGFDLGAHAQWRINGELARTTGADPIRVPIAELHANPVLHVAGLPVVVNLGLTCYLDVSADGTVSVDAEQEYSGSWKVRADYTGGHGWSPATDTGDTKVSPLRAHLTGRAAVQAGFGADVNVGLYDAVGVETKLEPYIRTRVDGSVSYDSSAGAPRAEGSWALYGGVDLTGALLGHLRIFGTPVVDKRIPLPAYHHEWPLKEIASR